MAGGLNLYAYVGNNPTRFVDPLGLAPGDPYFSPDVAAIHGERDINPTSIEENIEYAGYVYRNSDGTYSYTGPNSGSQAGSWPGMIDQLYLLLFNKKKCGIYHTHGGPDPQYDNENFSSTDKDTYDRNNILGYVGTPSGDVKKYVPVPGNPEGGTVTTIATGIK